MRNSIFRLGTITMFASSLIASNASAQTIPNPTALGLPPVSNSTVGDSNYNFDWQSNMNTVAPTVTRGNTYSNLSLRESSYSGAANIASVSVQLGRTVSAATAFKGGSDSVRNSAYLDPLMAGRINKITFLHSQLELPQTYATNPHGLTPTNNAGSGTIAVSSGSGTTASVGKVENQGGKMKYDKVDPEAEDILARFTKSKK